MQVITDWLLRSRYVLAVCAVTVFVYQQVMAFVDPFTRTMMEAANELIIMYNRQQLPIPMKRFASAQNKWLPWLAAQFDNEFCYLPFFYLANDALHYIILFAIVWRVSRSMFIACGMLLVNLLLWGGNFFVLTNELYLTLPWLFLANYICWRGLKQYRWVVLIAVVLAIWSHPVNLISLALCVVVFRYDRLLNRRWLTFLGVLCLLRLAVFTPHDGSKMMFITDGLSNLNWGDFSNYINGWVALGILALTLLFPGIKNWQRFIFLAGYAAITLLLAARQLPLNELDSLEIITPVYLIGVCFMWFMLARNDHAFRLLNVVTIGVGFYLLVGAYGTFRKNYDLAFNRANDLACIMQELYHPGFPKVATYPELLTKVSYDPGHFHSESLYLSAMMGPTIHLVIEDSATMKTVLKTPDDMLYLGPDYYFEIKHLRPGFAGNMHPNPYVFWEGWECAGDHNWDEYHEKMMREDSTYRRQMNEMGIE